MTPVERTSGEVVLRCENLHRYLGRDEGRVHVLKGVSFEARRGRVEAIVGPSGCGKSTLLYLLGLLDRPDGGEIEICGKAMATDDDLARTRARGEHIGFVFQFHFLLLDFTALENVLLPMRKLGRLSTAEMVTRGEMLLAQVGLADKARRKASHLSGGEQQRVAIARSLANNPALLLADEPTGNLDAANSSMVIELIGRLGRDHGLSTVLVTHNSEIAGRCDAVHAMKDGIFIR